MRLHAEPHRPITSDLRVARSLGQIPKLFLQLRRPVENQTGPILGEWFWVESGVNELHRAWFYCCSNIATRGNTKCPAASSMTLTWQV
jgi:hypothetical protein